MTVDFNSLQTISWNVQLKCSSVDHLSSLLSIVEHSYPSWHVCFFTEADAIQSSSFELKHPTHRVFRHWPGPGSRSMLFVVNAALSQMSCRVRGQNRVFGLDLSLRGTGKRNSICLVGVHGPHDTLDLHDHMGDVAHILGGRRAGSEVVLVGDWNVDMALTFAHCPCNSASQSSNENMSNRRLILETFAESSNLDFSFPAYIDGLPDDMTWHSMCTRFAFTRVPQGQQSGVPSLIDFALSSSNIITSCVGSWCLVPSDHCIVAFNINHRVRIASHRRSTWVIDDREAAVCYALANWPKTFSQHNLTEHSTPSRFCEFLRTVRDVNSDHASCRVRRNKRFPFHLRFLTTLYVRATGQRKHALRDRLWKAKVAWFESLRVSRVRSQIDRGGTVQRTKRMFTLKTLKQATGAPIADDHEIVSELGNHFSHKFGCSNSNLKQVALDYMRVCHGLPPSVDEMSVEAVLHKSKKPLKLDSDGICWELLRVAFEACPAQFCSFVEFLLGEESFLESLEVPMRCFGKTSSSPELTSVRAIMPLTALAKLLDSLLAHALKDALWSVFPKLPGCIVGAQRFTQCADIGHGAQLLMEKGADLRSRAAVAQGDIATYFDKLPLVRIFLFLRRCRVDVRLLCAILRHQLLIKLRLSRHGVHFKVNMRSSGGITGSTLALTLARIPVESAFRDLYDECWPLGFEYENRRLVFGSWVDNIYCASNNAESACLMLTRVFDYLRRHWGLEMKEGSGSCLVSRGHDFGDFEPLSNIPIVSYSVPGFVSRLDC